MATLQQSARKSLCLFLFSSKFQGGKGEVKEGKGGRGEGGKGKGISPHLCTL